MEDEQYSEPPPPPPERVARRALVLAVIACRGFTEGQPDKPDAAALAKRSFQWLQAIGLEDDLTPWESAILTAPFGTVAKKDQINASWLSEGMCILAWALGRSELPSFDQQCDPSGIANSLGLLQPTTDTVLQSPHLREPDELHEYNNFIYNVHWRVRDFSLNRNHYNFDSLARKAWGEPVLKFGLKLVKGDLALDGKPLSLAAEQQFRALTSITQERHRAANWLIGYESEDFYEVTTDT